MWFNGMSMEQAVTTLQEKASQVVENFMTCNKVNSHSLFLEVKQMREDIISHIVDMKAFYYGANPIQFKQFESLQCKINGIVIKMNNDLRKKENAMC